MITTAVHGWKKLSCDLHFVTYKM